MRGGNVKEIARQLFWLIVYPGRDMFCKGTVTQKYTENGENLAACDIWLEYENGEKVVAGGAVVSLPCADGKQNTL